MKKLFQSINIFLLSLFVFWSLAIPAHAQTVDLCPLQKPGQAHSQLSPLCALKGANAGGIIGTIMTILFIAAVVIALFFLIWGGIKWILSGGDKAGVEAARNTIIAAIIGLVLVFASYFILTLVIGFFLPGFDITRIQLPTFN